ncbi:hypothetical protein [Pseudoxanthomonas putridarboris]|uniref:Secreted protein n=1 Tax=Pseudoxanthomonas putridarboris TaxID=752605 RepID=A0ABU9IXZ1_9GAMM
MARRWLGGLLLGPAIAAAQDRGTSVSSAQQAEAASQQDGAPFLGGFLTETRILYPLAVGDWEARGEHRYEQAEMGVSVRYQHRVHRDRWVDIYFYPAGVLPQGRLLEEAKGTLEGVRQHGGYSRAEIAPLRGYAIATGSGKQRRQLPAYAVSMSLQRDGKDYSSAMVLLAKDLYFIKGRFSAEADALKPARVQSRLQALMEPLVRQTSLFSTGACWMPPPIVQVAVPDDAAAGNLMHIRREDGLRTVAFADRVEAVDPEAPEAKAMQLMSMSASGRWIPGCHPPEDMTPEVPATHREIRFEYRAPPERSDGNTPRLHGRRTGVG